MTWIGISSGTKGGKVTLSDRQWQILKYLAEYSSYWAGANTFMSQMKDKELSTLTSKQYDWFMQIDAELNDEINKIDAIEAYKGIDTSKITIDRIWSAPSVPYNRHGRD